MGYNFSSRLTATLNLCLIYFKITWALVILLEHMHKKFEINRTKIKVGCQSGRKVVAHDSKSDLPLTSYICLIEINLQVTGEFCFLKQIWKKICVLRQILEKMTLCVSLLAAFFLLRTHPYTSHCGRIFFQTPFWALNSTVWFCNFLGKIGF